VGLHSPRVSVGQPWCQLPFPFVSGVLSVRRMVPVVDLFSGPGGLAEGFSALRSPKGCRRFRVVLAIESGRDAHRTLRLRAFLRSFKAAFPSEYYDFLNGEVAAEPDWEALHPAQWAAACDEARCLELGTASTSAFLRERIEAIRGVHGGRTVLVGGPPCQPYSVIGRSRNVGNAGYDAGQDKRLSLYRQFAQVLGRLRPAVAVLENVKGMLSAGRNGKPIFPQVLRSLSRAGGVDSYRLFALTPRSGVYSLDEGLTHDDFLVHAEDHGVPQSRHRVFVVCVRSDLAETFPDECLLRLEGQGEKVSVNDVIGAMPMLRSRLSRGDSPAAWKAAVQAACALVEEHWPMMSHNDEKRFRRVLAGARTAANGLAPPWRDAHGGVDMPEHCSRELRDWIVDERIERLPNNETRAHMPSDLARYLFASAFAHAFRRSPKSHDFPDALAPHHANWHTGHFDDRYRVQVADHPGTTVTSHIAKDGHYFIHPDPRQCRSLTVREVARIQTFPDNYFFHGSRSQQYIQVGNAVPPFLAHQIARTLWSVLDHHDRISGRSRCRTAARPSRRLAGRVLRPGAASAMESA